MTLRNIDALFRSRRVALLGDPETAAQRQLYDNMQLSEAGGCVQVAGRAARSRLPVKDIDSAVVMAPRWGRPRLISAMGEAGYRALYWAAGNTIDADVLCAARPYNLRLLGSRSAGLIDTRSGLNLSTLALTPPAGQVALITQSQSLTAAALDWALGRNIGFSWLACTGAEADIDVADLLDHAALDPRTRAVVLQVGEIGSPRKFMSAARAAARVKPVLVLQTRRLGTEAPQGPDPVRSAAFARAGLVECENMGGLFDGLAALELLPRLRGERVMVLGNGIGVCTLGTDALLRENLSSVQPDNSTRDQLAGVAPKAAITSAGIDLGASETSQVVAAVEAALDDAATDTALLVHSPVAGHPHAPLVDAIAAAPIDARLMTVWLGLHTALAARHASAAARLATFASVDEAARAVAYRGQYRRTQELLKATPPPDPTVTANVGALRSWLAALAADGVEWLTAEYGRELLSAYSIGDTAAAPAGESSIQMSVQVGHHPEFGMTMQVSDDALGVAPAYGFAPLDGLLARRMLAEASAGRLQTTADAFESLTYALVRLGKLVVDLAQVVRLEVHIQIGRRGRLQVSTEPLIELTRTPLPERQRLAVAPYPARMRHRVTLAGERRYIVRAIRPPDEPAVLDLLDSLSPEEIRLRFFNTIRYFSHDMAARFTQVDYDREVSLVIRAEDTPDALAGMGTLIADPDGRQAEFAVLVHHQHTGIGLGRHLLDCLLRQAGARGVDLVYGDVLAHNQAMLGLARSLGFRVKRSLEDASSVKVEISTRGYPNTKHSEASAP